MQDWSALGAGDFSSSSSQVSVGGVAFRMFCRGGGAVFEIVAGEKDSMRILSSMKLYSSAT